MPPAGPPARHRGAAAIRAMRRSVSTPNDVDEAPPVPAAPKYASTDHLEGDPAGMSFHQRVRMLEQRQADGS